jgi:sarcosine oxidase subunit alpha
MNRLTYLPTLRIQPSKALSLTYNKKRLTGVEGDSVATALYANGIRIFSRSVKYHRPRGLYSLDGESSNCFMAVDGVPNTRTCTTLLKNGMTVNPQNVIGTPEHDWLFFLDYFGWAMPAGFYHRHFHRPYVLWPTFRKWIRKAAGFGKVNMNWEGGIYDELHLNTDVTVIGGGPAGMSAALAAANQGLRIVLIEGRPWLGGFFEYSPEPYTLDIPRYERARELAREIEKHPNIRWFCHTYLMGLYGNHQITAFQKGGEKDYFDERYIEVRSQSVVVATGCIERPLIFEHNERPGVMQVVCAHRLARTYGLLPGTKAVFSVGHDQGLEAALDLHQLGMKIPAVADIRFDGQNPDLVDRLNKSEIRYMRGWVAGKVYGHHQTSKITLRSTEGTREESYDCDVVVASAGHTPVSGPLIMAQAKLRFDLHTGFFLPDRLPGNVHPAGRLWGLTDPHAIECSGMMAGLKAAADCGAADDNRLKDLKEKLKELPGPERGTKLAISPGKPGKQFVCFDEDVTVKNIYQACDMGFDVPELNKRFTAAGTGPGQWGIPGHNLPLVISKYHADSTIPPMPTTIRPPMAPTLMATYAGKRHNIFKRTPAHEWQEKADAIFRRVGVWKRARYFSKDYSCKTEIETVHQAVGIIDVSTLGKFRLFGPDALKALQRVYIGDMSTVKKGRVKYSAMCNDDGCLIDDGVVTLTAENDYYFTTSTGRAGATVEWIRYHTRYDGWNFHLVNLTDAYGAINLAGPKARKVLSELTDDNLSNEAFPFTGYREMTLAGKIPARVMRLGFVGELSFEMHVPSSMTGYLWKCLMEAGKPFGIRPFGLEAQNVLRMQKGHVIIGQESEIRTTLHDLGMGGFWYKKPAAKTVGAVALKQTKHQKDRLKLVGFKMVEPSDPKRAPKDGSIIVNDTIRGHVCTARYSFILNEAIGLALMEDKYAGIGTQLEIFEDGSDHQRLHAQVVKPPFYDIEGHRIRM